MILTEKILLVEEKMRKMALEAMKNLPASDPAYRIAKYRSKRPIDYMRYAEFDALLQDMVILPRMQILDISSPQWFSLYLAAEHPEAVFHYVNITADEVEPYSRIAKSIGIKNLTYRQDDARSLKYETGTFDKCISVSVIEHIYPEVNGDLQALAEIKRALKPNGELLLTVPYKEQSNIVYMDGPVYERSAQAKNFFAREYDKETFARLIKSSGFAVKDSWFICEKTGMFSMDYYVWGPGKDKKSFSKYMLKALGQIARLPGVSFDSALAKRYLGASREIYARVVNIAAVLKKI